MSADIVEAGQEGSCGYCEEPIYEGDEIVLVHGWWCHADCALGKEDKP